MAYRDREEAESAISRAVSQYPELQQILKAEESSE
jgi:hypothetical protein